MELTSQVLRQVEFGSELRGYKTSEVDDFLEKVAVAIDEVRAELLSLREQLEQAQHAPDPEPSRSTLEDEESIRRTLVLAQRTADLAIKEAREEAAQVIEGARREADSIVADARSSADRLAAEGDRALRTEVDRLTAERDRLRSESDALVGLLAAERDRLTESLTATLGFVEKNLVPSSDLTDLSSKLPSPAHAVSSRSDVLEPDVDALEAAIAEDAAKAAPSRRSARHDRELDDEWEGTEAADRVGRPSLMALPGMDGSTGAEGEEQTSSWKLDDQANSPAS